MTYYTFFDTPAGTVLLTGTEDAITGIYWQSFKRTPVVKAQWIQDDTVFASVIQQLQEYFAGTRQKFDLTYRLDGTDFQKRVWQELLHIPYGQKTSYSAVAQAIGKPRAVRAVGTAIGSNPICIAIPCHRVLTSTNTLGGYAGGLDSKKVLLQTEGILFRE